MTEKPKGKWDKECPVCHQFINSKGFANHVRAHGVNPADIEKQEGEAGNLLNMSLEKVLREEARAILKEHPEIVEKEARKIIRERWGEFKQKIGEKKQEDEPGSRNAA